VWVYDLARGSGTRLTFEGGGSPVWSPDGTHLAISANGLKLLRADGTGKPEALAPATAAQTPATWSSAGNVIAFLQRPSLNTSGIWSLPMGEGAGARKPSLFLESQYGLRYAELSPDGRWLAYVSNESGTTEVYVQAFPSGAEKTRISVQEGYEPLWHPNSRELFYRTDLKFMSVTVRSVSPFRVDAPRVLFEPKPYEYDSTTPTRSWDITPDGRRFVLVRPVPLIDPPVSRINVAFNWIEELRRRLPR
jgi:Tol biopolymer transport system component